MDGADESMVPEPAAGAWIVGVGASAGGPEALQSLFEDMPTGLGLAFVVVQHQPADFHSRLGELLSRHTALSVREAVQGDTPAPDTVLLVPPGRSATVAEGRLVLADPEAGQTGRCVDELFTSLAQEAGSRAAGIVLSGTGSDGSEGAAAIRAVGGLVLVQSEDSAVFADMAQAAIASGAADLALPPREMPAALARLVRGTEPAGPDDFAGIFELLAQRFDTDFACYRPGTMSRRIGRRMAMAGLSGPAEYARLLRERPEEIAALYRDLLIGVTCFFRDARAFEFLEREVVPGLFTRAVEAAAGGEACVRAWAAGCASGEEVYSLAMLFAERAGQADPPAQVKIFATDVHKGSLARAAAGVFGEEALSCLTPQRRERFFAPHPQGVAVSQELRRMIVFAEHDILRDPPFTRVDMISCRNLLIYLKPPVQKRVFSRFLFALRPGGVLFLGPSESTGSFAGEFTILDGHWRIFAKRPDSRRRPYGLFGPAGRQAEALSESHARAATAPGGGQAASEASRALLAALTREVRGSIASIQGLALRVLASDLPGQERAGLEALLAQAGRLSSLIDDAQDLARIEAGRLKLSGGTFHPTGLLAATVGRAAGPAEAKGLALSLDIAPGMPETAAGDADRFSRVLGSLIEAVVRAADDGAVLVRARPLAGGQAGIEVAVLGSGLPLAPGEGDAAFGLAAPGAGRRFGGLGLTAARGLAEAMGGSLAVHGEQPGVGFLLRLPWGGP